MTPRRTPWLWLPVVLTVLSHALLLTAADNRPVATASVAIDGGL